MTLATVLALVTPFIDYFTALAVSGVGVAYVTELLKSPKVKGLPVSRYPRTTAVILAIIATFISMYTLPAAFIFTTWYHVTGFAIGTVIIASIYYNQLIAGIRLTTNSK